MKTNDFGDARRTEGPFGAAKPDSRLEPSGITSVTGKVRMLPHIDMEEPQASAARKPAGPLFVAYSPIGCEGVSAGDPRWSSVRIRLYYIE